MSTSPPADTPTDDTPIERPTFRRPWWMHIAVVLAFLIVAANVVAFLYARSLPKSWTATATVEIEAPIETVFGKLGDVTSWPEWIAWNQDRDPTIIFTFVDDKGTSYHSEEELPPSVELNTLRWMARGFGNGEITLTERNPPNEVRYSWIVQGRAFTDGGSITLSESENGTQVTWTDGGQLNDTMSRIFGNVLRDGVKSDFETSLQKLKQSLEKN
ncbi:SRPBCC family protein [Calycomorphotria hydatis]|uniref:Polyketide cyclase / dehydrase and lipid transport n=1 Tax=Calycomorphotria hydatis TaxID=2528027 RepID=A0A517T5R0_9PLAN|nr:SRPBCC family protein [Calycomorphotria hydatis]QDT63715.1 Polyketide cyclase / dehydrase and lipid transport [Calycomorphotria hydatis]